MIDTKELIAIIAVSIGLISYIPYFLALYKKTVKPHVFSWLVWGILAGIAFFGQLHNNAGAGAWATGFTAVSCIIIAFIAIFRGEKNITKSDWFSFIGALSAVPLWLITQTPFYSIILITLIDISAYYPTIRKSYIKPHEEISSTFILNGLKYLIALFALNHYSVITALYPFSTMLAEFGVAFMLIWRRHILRTLRR